jgi:hypothetical protein
LERVASLDEMTDPLSVAIASSGAAFVSYDSGLARVELTGGSVTPVSCSDGEAALAGLERIRWARRSIVAVQRQSDGTRRSVRVRLDRRGRKATAIDVLEPTAPPSAGGAAAIAGDTFFYLVADERGTVLKRVPLLSPRSAKPRSPAVRQ